MNDRELREYLIEKERSFVRRMGTCPKGYSPSKRTTRLLRMLGDLNYCKLVGNECSATELRARRLLVILRRRALFEYTIYFCLFNIACLTLSLMSKSSFTLFLAGSGLFIIIVANHLKMIAHHSKLIKEINSSTTRPPEAPELLKQA